MNFLLFSYLGPWLPLPFLSLLIALFGVFMMFGRWIIQFFVNCFRAVVKKQPPTPGGPS